MTRRLALILLLALLSAMLDHHRGLYLFDEGIIMYGAHSIVHGEPIYDEVRVNYGPGILWTVAGLFRLLGESMLWPRLLMAVVFVGMVILCRSIALAVSCDKETADLLAIALIGYRAFLFPHWTMTSYTPLSVLFFLVVVRLLLGPKQADGADEMGQDLAMKSAGEPEGSSSFVGRAQGAGDWFRSPSSRLVLGLGPRPVFSAAGFAAGFAFLFKQNVGILAMGFIGIAAVLAKNRKAVALLSGVLGTLAAIVPALLFLAATGSLSGFWHYAIAGNARIWTTWSMPFPWLLSDLDISRRAFFYVPAELFAILFRHPTVMAALVRTHLLPLAVRLFYLAPLAVIVALGVRFARSRDRDRFLLASAAALLLLLAWPICTVLHFATAALLALVALASYAKFRPRTVKTLLCLVAASGLLLQAISASADRRRVQVGDFTIWASPRQARRYTSMTRFIESHVGKGEKILVVPTAPMYYFATGRESAIEDDFVLPPWADEKRIAAIVLEMKERPIRVVIRNHGEFPFMPRLVEFGKPILEELRRDYRLVYKTPPPRDEVWLFGKGRGARPEATRKAASRRGPSSARPRRCP